MSFWKTGILLLMLPAFCWASEKSTELQDLEKLVEVKQQKVARLEKLMEKGVVSATKKELAEREYLQARFKLVSLLGNQEEQLKIHVQMYELAQRNFSRVQRLAHQGYGSAEEVDVAAIELALIESRYRMAFGQQEDAATAFNRAVDAATRNYERRKKLYTQGYLSKANIEEAQEVILQIKNQRKEILGVSASE